MNRRRQPFFFALLVLLAAGAFICPASSGIAAAFASLHRVWFNAVSIVLAAAPFVLAGALGAFAVERLRLRGAPALLAAVLAPGCDCSMNGFANALADSPPRLAGAALALGAACNPIALMTTAAVLGPHLVIARLFGAAVAAFGIWFSWGCAGEAAGHCGPHEVAAGGMCGITAKLERGLRTLMPAVLVGAIVPILMGARSLGHASPLMAALFGALLSTCSSADPVLASVLARDAPAQAAFMLASQCADVRLLWLVLRSFGVRRMLFVAIAGVCGCAAAALAAR